VLRHDAHLGEHRHEVGVAVPARHDVPVEVVLHARAGAAPEIHAEVEALGVERLVERRERPPQRLRQIGVLAVG